MPNSSPRSPDARQSGWHRFRRPATGWQAASDIYDHRAALFASLESAETQPAFWARVADDVDWTVEGTHALCGRYRSKADFIAATFDRLRGVLVGGATLKVRHLYLDGDTTIAELRSTSKTNEGATFANNYCWVCRFDGDVIVEARAYLDSAMVDYTVHRNENLAWQYPARTAEQTPLLTLLAGATS